LKIAGNLAENPPLMLPPPSKTACSLLAAVAVATGSATQAEDRLVDGIMDNSFLVEEAYNQEQGVVQHIGLGVVSWDDSGPTTLRDALLSFTQEWPLGGRTHQLSYSLPFTSFQSDDGSTTSGLGDVFLNYRYQAIYDEETLRALAPRFSLILPTGDPNRLLGDDTLGAQVNVPFSQAVGERWFVHANAGATYLPNSGTPVEVDRLLWNLGGSGILALTRSFHVLLEGVGVSNETPAAGGGTERELEAILSPGARFAHTTDAGAQLVFGMAVPFGVTGPIADVGLIVYLSFEHSFRD
jgi:hypothetical protein